jgi:hypothetical protein
LNFLGTFILISDALTGGKHSYKDYMAIYRLQYQPISIGVKLLVADQARFSQIVMFSHVSLQGSPRNLAEIRFIHFGLLTNA